MPRGEVEEHVYAVGDGRARSEPQDISEEEVEVTLRQSVQLRLSVAKKPEEGEIENKVRTKEERVVGVRKVFATKVWSAPILLARVEIDAVEFALKGKTA